MRSQPQPSPAPHTAPERTAPEPTVPQSTVGRGRSGGRRVLVLAGTVLVGGVSAALVVAGFVTPEPPQPLPPLNAGHAAMPPQVAAGDVPGPMRQPSPDPRQRDTFLRRLEGIAPWLVPEEGTAMSRARATCRDILQGKSTGELVSDAQERFTDVTRQQAAEIVEAVREWCRTP